MSTVRSPTDIRRVCSRLRAATTRRELATALYQEVSRYSLLDLQAMRARVERDLRSVPAGYRQRLYPSVMEQIFATHHTLISTMRRSGADVPDESLPVEFQDFCNMVEKTCLREGEEEHLELLYFLLAAFNLFALCRPAHPVGTPFPGGSEVESRNGEYLCPVREKADDVENALCPYCPAKQSDI